MTGLSLVDQMKENLRGLEVAFDADLPSTARHFSTGSRTPGGSRPRHSGGPSRGASSCGVSRRRWRKVILTAPVSIP